MSKIEDPDLFSWELKKVLQYIINSEKVVKSGKIIYHFYPEQY